MQLPGAQCPVLAPAGYPPSVVTLTRPPDVALHVSAGVVLLGPFGVDLVRRAVDTSLRVLQRDGIGMSPQLRELHEVIRAAASAAGTCSGAHCGTAEPAAALARAACAAQDVLSVGEVAQVLDCSDGFVRRLCRTGALESARRVAGRWQVDRIEVEALRAARARNEETA